jgi:WS/DGAT/MGAT family acyltransferase
VFRRVDATLASHREIRTRYGTTVNDVILAVVAGGLRGWLQSRGEVLAGTTTVRAMVPVSLRGHHASGDGPAEGADPRTGNVVSAFFVDLPVGEPVAAIRLQQIAMAMKGLKDAGQPLGARSVISVVGNGPTTMHAMAARVVNAMSDRVFGLTVTNIPGPQEPLYLCGALMRSVHPVPPLAHRQALSVAVSSYDGTLGYGLIADAEAVPDLDVLAESIDAAVAELREHRPRRRPKSAVQA